MTAKKTAFARPVRPAERKVGVDRVGSVKRKISPTEMAKLAEVGLSRAEIAEVAGVDPKTVSALLAVHAPNVQMLTAFRPKKVEYLEEMQAELLLAGVQLAKELRRTVGRQEPLKAHAADLPKKIADIVCQIEDKIRLLTGKSTEARSILMTHYLKAEGVKPVSVINPRALLPVTKGDDV